MTEEKKEVVEAPVPLAIRQLIELHNNRIREYQQTSLRELQDANVELMTMMGLLPQEGWRLDMESMKYVKIPTETSNGNTQV
jgi:hypothetical protein